MSVRLLLAVVVATALIASSIPAIDAAQQARADQTLTESTERIQDAVELLARQNDPVPPGVPGAQRRIRVEIPGNVRDAELLVGSTTDGSHPADGNQSDVVATSFEGHEPQITSLDADVRVVREGEIRSDETGLTIREDAVITLSYVRVDGEPTVVMTRGFKSPDRTNQAHVRVLR